MRIVEKALYEVICINREEKINKRKLKAQINYINVFSDSESEIKLKNKRELRNNVTEVYTVYINTVYMTARCSSVEKLMLSKYH